MSLLNPSNRKVLAYIREHENERVLCVANLSRFHQPVELDLASFAGMVPIEMLGYVEFPKITKQRYPLTVGPYGFLWLELQPSREAEPDRVDESSIAVTGVDDWVNVLEGSGRTTLEESVFKDFLPRQRWFGRKSQTIGKATIEDWAAIAGAGALVLVNIEYTSGETDLYLVPVAMVFGREANDLREAHPGSILSTIDSPDEEGVLYDASCMRGACEESLRLISDSGNLPSRKGSIRGKPSTILDELRGGSETDLAPRVGSAEQSNTSVLYGDKLILKLFRRVQAGPNPDIEISQYLTEKTHFSNIAPFGGSIEYLREGQPNTTLGMLQGFVENEGDGWQWTLEELDRYYEATAAQPAPKEYLRHRTDWLRARESEAKTAFERDQVGIYLDAAALLGVRSAEMHLALSQSPPGNQPDPAFLPEPLTRSDLELLREDLIKQANGAFSALKGNLVYLPDNAVELAALALSKRRSLLDGLDRLLDKEFHSTRIRIHGDFHLGQVLRTKADFVILDFEGEPARPLEERRKKQSAMKDIAGMLRSFNYAAASALIKYSSRRPEDFEQLEPWARLWRRSVCSAFLRSYRATAGKSDIVPLEPGAFEKLLTAYLLDKVLYELSYELNNRPAWVRIPLLGILELAGE